MLVYKEIIINKIKELKEKTIEKLSTFVSTDSSSSSGSSSSSSQSGSSSQQNVQTIESESIGITPNLKLSEDPTNTINQYFEDFINVFNQYTNRGNSEELGKAIKEVLRFSYGAIYARRVRYEKDVDFNLPDFISSYKKLDSLFFDMKKIKNIDPEEFLSKTKFKTVTTTSSTGSGSPSSSSSSSSSQSKTTFLGNQYIDQWKNEITSMQALEIEKLTEISDWLRNDSDGDFYLKVQFEDLGKIAYSPTKEEIMNAMYIDTNLLVIIDYFKINTFIPSSYSEEDIRRYCNRYFL